MSILDRFRKKLTPKARDLTDAARQDLTSIHTHPGYQVVLCIIEQVCEAAETKHFQMSPLNYTEAQIAASHTEARAMRLGFERVQKRIEYEINEGLGIPQPQGQPDLDDPHTVERLLDPIGWKQWM